MDTNKLPEPPSGSPGKLPDWLKPGWLLGVFSLVFIFALALSNDLTRERIAEQEKIRLLAQLKQLLVTGSYDNEPENDVRHDEKTGRTIYRVRQNNQPVAALITTTAPDGYSGSIHLLVGIRTNGDLIGVRALKHQETPGLGDAIDLRKSNWISGFSGKSLSDPPPKLWAVRKDGGIFDAFTGATVTPRAVINEVKNTLQYFRRYQQELFQ